MISSRLNRYILNVDGRFTGHGSLLATLREQGEGKLDDSLPEKQNKNGIKSNIKCSVFVSHSVSHNAQFLRLGRQEERTYT